MPAKTAFAYQGFNIIAFNTGDFADGPLLRRSLDFAVAEGSNLLVVDWMVAFEDTGVIVPATDRRSHEPPLSDIRRLVDQARQRGLRVFLKPHVGFPSNAFANRSHFNTDRARFSLPTFFRDWASYLTNLALSISGVDCIVIGTEFTGFDKESRGSWADLIGALRRAYGGKVAYDVWFSIQSTQGTVADVAFWDLVDIIGLSLYVPLSRNDNATLQELNSAWRRNPFGDIPDVIRYLRDLSAKYNKPVMALEAGYQSIEGGLYDVGPVPEGRTVNNEVQAAGIRSYLDTLTKYQGDWFAGVSIWSIFPPFMDPARHTEWGYRQGYMPNGKPAQEVIRTYFTRETPYSDRFFAGNDSADIVRGSYANDRIEAGGGNDLVFGGDGDDEIVAGPEQIASRTTTEVVIRAHGQVRDGAGPRFRLVINNQPVGDAVEVTRSWPSAPQEFSFRLSLDRVPRITSFTLQTLPDPRFAEGVNRWVTVKEIEVNGYALSEADGTYRGGGSAVSGPGSWAALFSNTSLSQNVDANQDFFLGATSDDDEITGGPGDDRIDGGAGVNVAVFDGPRERFVVTSDSDATVTVMDTRGTEGRDTLTRIHNLRFTDGMVAAPNRLQRP